MTKFGKTIIPKGTFPEKHELETAWFLNDIGKDIEFLVPVDKNHIKTPDIKMDGILCTLSFLNNSISIKTPDIKMDGILWEIKVPKNKGKHTIQHAFRKALYQSKYVIFDLPRIKMATELKCLMIMRYLS